MTGTAKVSLEHVRRVAELASLELTTEEEVRIGRDLNSILDYVAQLNELDTSTVEPMAQVSEVLDAAVRESLREDQLAPSLDRERVLVSAPDHDAACFRVPKVIER